MTIVYSFILYITLYSFVCGMFPSCSKTLRLISQQQGLRLDIGKTAIKGAIPQIFLFTNFTESSETTKAVLRNNQSRGSWSALCNLLQGSLLYTKILVFYFPKVNSTESKEPSQVVLMVENPSANAGDARDVGSIPRSGRSPRGGVAIHSSIHA